MNSAPRHTHTPSLPPPAAAAEADLVTHYWPGSHNPDMFHYLRAAHYVLPLSIPLLLLSVSHTVQKNKKDEGETGPAWQTNGSGRA